MAWHSNDYQKLINCDRWRRLRNWYISQHPLCERCLKDGIYTSAQCVHHIQPVEDSRNKTEMAALAYNPNNLMALCTPCHVAIHKEMGKSTTEKKRERKEQRVERAMELLFGNKEEKK